MTTGSGELAERALRWGVETSFDDYCGVRRAAPEETVAAIVEWFERHGADPPAPAATVVRPGEGLDVSLWSELELEDGSAVALGDRLPADVPLGYHTLVGGGRRHRLIVSPGTCWLPDGLRAWGWAVQLYALRSRRSWGIGDLGDLRRFGRWAASTGASAILLNPLHAASPGVPQQPSPYFPSSRCWLNPLYADVEGVLDGRDRYELAERGRVLSRAPLIERDRIYELKTSALGRAFEAAARPPGLERFRAERGGLLEAFATFAALAERYGPRSQWPPGLDSAGAPGVAAWRACNRERVVFHEWVQWVLDGQLAAAAGEIGLLFDLAVGVDAAGADAWLWPDCFVPGTRVGAPPDEFNTGGQDWGFPPPDPWVLRAAGYEPFVETIRAALRHGAGVRIDHVMGLFRLYWIPPGAGARDGAYVRYPHRDLLDIVALESHRARSYVVGEDLGTVEPLVRSEMGARDMLSYKLLWFEDGPPETYPQHALAAVTNHDLPTVAGLWTGSDLEVQTALGLQPNEGATAAARSRLARWIGAGDGAPVTEVAARTYELLAAAPSAVVLATLEDALAVRDRPNMPGTTDEHPNWRRPLPVSLEAITGDPLVNRIAGALGSGRSG